MPEGNYHVKYSMVDITKLCLETNKLRNINIPVMVQLNRFPQLFGRQGGLIDMRAD